MYSLVGQSFGLACVNDDEFSEVVDFYSARFQCVIQRVNDRRLAVEIARRSRPIMVIADGELLKEHLQDFISRIRTRRPSLDIIIMHRELLAPSVCPAIEVLAAPVESEPRWPIFRQAKLIFKQACQPSGKDAVSD